MLHSTDQLAELGSISTAGEEGMELILLAPIEYPYRKHSKEEGLLATRPGKRQRTGRVESLSPGKSSRLHLLS